MPHYCKVLPETWIKEHLRVYLLLLVINAIKINHINILDVFYMYLIKLYDFFYYRNLVKYTYTIFCIYILSYFFCYVHLCLYCVYLCFCYFSSALDALNILYSYLQSRSSLYTEHKSCMGPETPGAPLLWFHFSCGFWIWPAAIKTWMIIIL